MNARTHALILTVLLCGCPDDEAGPTDTDATVADSLALDGDVALEVEDTTVDVELDSDAPTDTTLDVDVPEVDVDTVVPDPEVSPEAAGVVSDFVRTVSFLWEEGGPQVGVELGAIDPARVAVVRGRVFDATGAPLPGVSVRVLGADALGRTDTRPDGGFDLALNGGGRVVIDYTKAGYLGVQRTIDTPWVDWVAAPDVVLTALDPGATTVTLGAAAPRQIARGSVASDADGERVASVIFPAGTVAELVMPDGARAPLTSGTMRATEYTVGAAGPDAMPGDLPASSAYTYAVELSFDEALAAGATTVTFATPVVLVVDNFLDYPAGTVVPVGTYDRVAGLWRPDPDGLIVDLLGVAAGMALVDADGDGAADETVTLDALGIDAEERAALAELYPDGGSIWRTPLTHFSPKDCNWAFFLPNGASWPVGLTARARAQKKKCGLFGSFIDCDSQSLGEQVALIGTDLVLAYESSRTPGRLAERHARVPLTGDTIPPEGFLGVEVRAKVAGQSIVERFAPLPNQVFEHTWNGLDAYGDVVHGPTAIDGVIAFLYRARSATTAGTGEGFGAPGAVIIGDGDFRSEREIALTAPFSVPLATLGPDARELGVGGWMIDVHHVLDPVTGTVFLGSGALHQIEGAVQVYAGVDGPTPQSYDGVAVASTPINAGELQVAPDGALHFLAQGVVYRVDAAGITRVAVGCAPPGDDCTRDEGELATRFGDDADGNDPLRVFQYTLGFDGRIVFVAASFNAKSIWEVTPDGRVRRIGGVHATGGNEPVEGALARDLRIAVSDVAAGADGSTYFTQSVTGNAQLWRISPSGRLSRHGGVPHAVTQGAGGCVMALGGPGRDTCFAAIADIAPDRKGNVYVWAQFKFDDTRFRILRIRADGRVELFAGPGPFGCLAEPDAVHPKAFCTDYPRELRIGPDDVPHVTTLLQPAEGPMQHALVRLDEDATRVIFGGGSAAAGGPATMYANDSAGDASFALTPDGRFYVASQSDARILTVSERQRLDDDRYVIVGDGGRAAWIFDRAGRHLATRDVLTGATFWSFAYDEAGRLASVTDRRGGLTTIEREPDGTPSAIVAPGGERTTLTVDDAGWLERIASPDGTEVAATYDPSGLMRTWVDAAGRGATFEWDALGRLEREVNRLGGELTLTRTELPDGGHSVDATLEGETTRYVSEQLGDIEQHSVIYPSGAMHVVRSTRDGAREVIGSDGTYGRVETDIDPRFPQPYTSRLELTKNGITEVQTIRRTLTGGDGLFGAGVLTQTTTIDARVWTLTIDGPARAVSQTTPEGRIRTRTFDARGELVSLARGAGLAPTVWAWSDDGLLESVTEGDRSITLTYDDAGRVAVVDGPVRRVELVLDDTRPIALRDTDGETTLAWSDDGLLAGWTMPQGQAHVLASNAHGGYTSYRPPDQAQGYQRVYDAAGYLERIVLPSGRTQTLTGTDGRLDRIVHPEAQVDFDWPDSPSELPDAVTRTPVVGQAHAISYAWHDGLAAEVATTGAVAGRSVVTWGDDFAPVAQLYTSGSDTVNHTIDYDDDGFVVAYGPLAITRDGPDRATGTITLDGASITYTYNAHGDLASKTVRVAGQDRYALSVTYGATGLPATRSETAGVTRAFTYGYDPIGRLEVVTEDGDEVERYAYDPRGNRVLAHGETATYDAQDRLDQRGAIAYDLDVDGFLATRGADTFAYSTAGELVTATVAGQTSTWSYDAYRRMVRRDDASGALELHYADPFVVYRPSAYRAPGEALTWLYFDDLGHLVALQRGSTRWIVASDQLGSPRLVIDATGTIVKERRWDAFGRLLADSAPSFVLPIGFAGGIEDARVGLVRFGLRDYEPASGRWTARDPILVSGGQLNLYAYVASAPVGYRDPLGLYCVGATAYAGMGGGGKMCFDRTGFSVCTELGFGVGESIDVNPTGGIDENFFGFTGGIKRSYGPVSGGCDGDYGVALDNVGTTACNVIDKFDCKGSFNGSKLSLGKLLDGDPNGAWSGDPLKLVPPETPKEKPFEYKREGKLAVKGCQNAPWNLF